MFHVFGGRLCDLSLFRSAFRCRGFSWGEKKACNLKRVRYHHSQSLTKEPAKKIMDANRESVMSFSFRPTIPLPWSLVLLLAVFTMFLSSGRISVFALDLNAFATDELASSVAVEAVDEPGREEPFGPVETASETVDAVASEASDTAASEAPHLSLEEALRVTLEKQPSIQQMVERVAIQHAGVKQAQGAFDKKLTVSLDERLTRSPYLPREQMGVGAGHARAQDYTLQVGVSRKNRAGVQIFPNLQIHGARMSPAAAGRSPDLLGDAGLNFTIVAPLRRGRNEDLSTAMEKSARLDLDATGQDMMHQVSVAIYSTILAYWDYQGALARLEIQNQATARSVRRVEELKKLIAGDQVAAVEINQALADLADNQASVSSSKQSVTEAKTQLCKAMGLALGQMPTLAVPTTNFPDFLPEELPAEAASLLEVGLSRRHDLQAVKLRKVSGETLLPALRQQTKPSLNVRFDVGYNGLVEGGSTFRPAEALFKNTAGLNSTFKVTYDFPLENRSSTGRLSQQHSQIALLDIQQEDLARTIRLNIRAAYDGVVRQIEELRNLEVSGEKYRTALSDGEKKLKLGMSSVLDILTLENRMTGVFLKRLGAQQNLAKALARLQFETGGLFLNQGAEGTLSLDHLFRIAIEENPPASQTRVISEEK